MGSGAGEPRQTTSSKEGMGVESLSDSEKHESSDVHMAFVCPGEPAGTKGLAWVGGEGGCLLTRGG